jgi:hypothetical protein
MSPTNNTNNRVPTSESSSTVRRSARTPKPRDRYYTEKSIGHQLVQWELDEVRGRDQPGGQPLSEDDRMKKDNGWQGQKLYDHDLKPNGWTWARRCVFRAPGITSKQEKENVNMFTGYIAIFEQWRRDGNSMHQILARPTGDDDQSTQEHSRGAEEDEGENPLMDTNNNGNSFESNEANAVEDQRNGGVDLSPESTENNGKSDEANAVEDQRRNTAAVSNGLVEESSTPPVRNSSGRSQDTTYHNQPPTTASAVANGNVPSPTLSSDIAASTAGGRLGSIYTRLCRLETAYGKAYRSNIFMSRLKYLERQLDITPTSKTLTDRLVLLEELFP